MVNTSAKIWNIVAIIALSIASYQGYKAYRILVEKAQAQTVVTESVRRWKQNYKALGESVKRWERDYRTEASVDGDLTALFATVNFADAGLSANIDTLGIDKIEPVPQNGMSIGLTKLCLATSGATEPRSVEVKASDYQTLFSGIKRLANRSDIHIGTISIKGDKPEPMANLGDFCVLLSK